jgi:hypothetical protein
VLQVERKRWFAQMQGNSKKPSTSAADTPKVDDVDQQQVTVLNIKPFCSNTMVLIDGSKKVTMSCYAILACAVHFLHILCALLKPVCLISQLTMH